MDNVEVCIFLSGVRMKSWLMFKVVEKDDSLTWTAIPKVVARSEAEARLPLHFPHFFTFFTYT